MKSINKMALAAALALSGAGLASAQTIHVTGSTAYRVADVSAEVAVCGGATAKAAYFGSSSLTGANYSVVENSGGTLIFENFFNGSIAGDEALVDGVTTITFPTPSDLTPTQISSVGTPTTPAAGGAGTSSSTFTGTSTFADISFSDVAFTTAQKIILNSSDKTNTTPTGDLQVGIVPFVFVINASTDVPASHLTQSAVTGTATPLSMDPQKFTYIWQSVGAADLALLTGNSADAGTLVYPLGRDVDSGTRASALAEAAYTLKGNGANAITQEVYQYFPYASTSDVSNGDGGNGSTSDIVGWKATSAVPGFSGVATGTINAIGLVPTESIDGYSMTPGDGGYYSGSNLAVAMGSVNNDTAATNGSNPTALVAYLGASDAQTALGHSSSTPVQQAATLLAYNGVVFNPSTNPAVGNSVNNVLYGAYTYWSYEHLFYKDNNSIGSGLATEATALKNALNGNTSTLDEESSFGVTLTAMQVTRSGDGLNVQ